MVPPFQPAGKIGAYEIPPVNFSLTYKISYAYFTIFRPKYQDFFENVNKRRFCIGQKLSSPFLMMERNMRHLITAAFKD
jgi:hypothetical protein